MRTTAERGQEFDFNESEIFGGVPVVRAILIINLNGLLVVGVSETTIKVKGCNAA